MSGTNWVSKTYNINGHWSIESKDDKRYVVFGDDFSTPRGPDVKVFLSQKRMEDIHKRESVDIDGLFLGEIATFKGMQSYEIPTEAVLEDYESIVIHCKAYSVVWGGTNLK
ncbi:MAG: electron transfer flavoprotein [Winogradskyella sp.]|nr:MAG: electron transfer flavoprotein [Winogradskyella sp.]